MTVGYAHPEALVEPAWLAAHLDDPAIRIVDATFTMPGMTPTAAEIYAREHVPGAVWFDIDAVAAQGGTLPHMVPSAEVFADAMEKLGIGDAHRVIIYDGHGLMSAGRVWWMLRLFGHDSAAILDGGMPRWKAEGHPVADAVPNPAAARFTARFRPELLRVKAQLLADLGTAELVVDARAAGRFEGSAPESWPGRRSGHMPGSRNLPYDALTDPETRRLKDAAAIEGAFEEAGIGHDKPLVASCGSGVTACAVAFAAHLVGRPDVAIYDGSWAEWGLPGETPVVTGKEDPA